MSASCCLVSFPSEPCGIVLRMRSNKSPTVRPFQFERNAPPVNAAAPPPPTSESPWHEAHSFRYISSPRLACSSVYTPSQTDRDVGAVSCARSTLVARVAIPTQSVPIVATPMVAKPILFKAIFSACIYLCDAQRSLRLFSLSPEGCVVFLGSLRRRQTVRNIFPRIRAAAHRHHDVLLALHHIRHRRTALRRRHVHRADFLPGLLVVSAQHRAARMLRGRGDLSIAGDHQRLGYQCPDV